MSPLKMYQKKFENLSRHEIRSAVIGMVLGDANLQMRATNARLQMAHKVESEDYVLLKQMIVNQIPGVSMKYTHVQHVNRKLGKVYPTLRVWTNGHEFFTKMKDRLYAPQKRINKGILSSLTPLGVALWFMDDGHLSLGHNAKRYATDEDRETKERSIAHRDYKLHTNSFTEEENHMIAEWFLQRFGVKFRVKEEKRGNTFFLHANTENARNLADVIRPYVLAVESMHKKIDFRYTEKSPTLLKYNVQPWLNGTMEEGQECVPSQVDEDIV